MESGNDPRIERLKEVLSASYPRVEDQAELEPLPQSVIDRFQPAGKVRPSFFFRFASWLAHPLPALGVAAIAVLCAVFLNRPNLPKEAPGPDIRSKADSAAVPSLILVDAPDEVMKKFRASGYFPDELLSEAGSYTPGEAPVVVLDWNTRTVIRHLPGKGTYKEEIPTDHDELLELVLTLYQESFSR